jgi:CRISPR-associated protein Csx3
MKTFKMSFDAQTSTLSIGFNPEMPANNDQIVKDAAELCKENAGAIAGAKCLKITGAASLPVAMVLAHAFCHTVQAIACFDPKLQKFVVCISHSADFAVGQLVD